jgi:NitT/TauT family transport system substrate-binding protein
MRLQLSVLLICSTVWLSACSAVAPGVATPSPDPIAEGAEESLQQISLGVGFVPNVQFAPLYVGIEKGFYQEEGIDLQLAYGFEDDYVKLVGTNQMQFMIGSGDQMVLGRAQGLPVRYVMNWFTRFPVVIFAKQEAGITEPADLAGKSIGIPGPFGASYVAFRGILEAAGLKESDVRMESIGFTQAAAISQDTVDAAVDYAVNGPVILALQGIETTQIGLDQYIRAPANGLVTNDQTIEQNPALVRSMVQATLRSIQYTLDHPDEAFEIALRFVPAADNENRTANRAVFDASLPYWTPQPGRVPGSTQLEEWQETAVFIQHIGLADSLVEAESLFTNEFIE